MADWLEFRRRLTPGKTAIIDADTGERLTYAEFDRRATALAARLQRRCGVAAGDRVAVLAQASPDVFVALFAAQKLGAVLVPLNTRLSMDELSYVVDDAEPKVLLHDAAFADQAGELLAAGTSPAALAFSAPADADDPAPTGQPGPEQPWLILYTSGTTGRPKGAVLTQRSVTANAVQTCVSWELHRDDVALNVAPLFHTGGLNVYATPLFHLGGTMVLMRRFEPGAVLSAIARHRVTLFFGVPTMYTMLLEDPAWPSAELSSIRFLISGGAPCPPEVGAAIRERGVPFREGYGLTEVGPNCFAMPLEEAPRRPGSVGGPVIGERVRIVDEKDDDVGPGRVGELLLAGDHAFAGYWRNPDATQAAFAGPFVRTGDLAYRDGHGFFYIVDRKKDLIISGGENIYPAEVERVLLSHPDVAEAAVIAQPDARWGEVGLAFVVPRAGSRLTAAALRAYCQSRLARYKVPKVWREAEVLPRTSSGKVQKAELRKNPNLGRPLPDQEAQEENR